MESSGDLIACTAGFGRIAVSGVGVASSEGRDSQHGRDIVNPYSVCRCVAGGRTQYPHCQPAQQRN